MMGLLRCYCTIPFHTIACYRRRFVKEFPGFIGITESTYNRRTVSRGILAE
jgi:hypothetical protein